MNIKNHIPNLLTLVNATCGGIAVVLIMQGHIVWACLLVIVGSFVDFFDGFVARALKVSSELGKQLDSLSDVITFGVVPAMLAQHLYLTATTDKGSLLAFVPLVIIPFSAYRLGKFNIDTRQTTSFLGLPTPANAIFWVGMAAIQDIYSDASRPAMVDAIYPLFQQPWLILALSIVFAILLVTEIPLFALKFKGFGWKGNEVKFIFLALSLLLLAVLQVAALPAIIILYILLSIINNLLTRNP